MGEGRRSRGRLLAAASLVALLCLAAPASGQQVAGAAKQAAEQVASSAKQVVQEQVPGISKAANASSSTGTKGASGTQLDEQVDEAIDAQEYKELPDQEVVAQVLPQESAAKLANSDGDVATTGKGLLSLDHVLDRTLEVVFVSRCLRHEHQQPLIADSIPRNPCSQYEALMHTCRCLRFSQTKVCALLHIAAATSEYCSS